MLPEQDQAYLCHSLKLVRLLFAQPADYFAVFFLFTIFLLKLVFMRGEVNFVSSSD